MEHTTVLRRIIGIFSIAGSLSILLLSISLMLFARHLFRCRTQSENPTHSSRILRPKSSQTTAAPRSLRSSLMIRFFRTQNMIREISGIISFIPKGVIR